MESKGLIILLCTVVVAPNYCAIVAKITVDSLPLAEMFSGTQKE